MFYWIKTGSLALCHHLRGKLYRLVDCHCHPAELRRSNTYGDFRFSLAHLLCWPNWSLHPHQWHHIKTKIKNKKIEQKKDIEKGWWSLPIVGEKVVEAPLFFIFSLHVKEPTNTDQKQKQKPTSKLMASVFCFIPFQWREEVLHLRASRELLAFIFTFP